MEMSPSAERTFAGLLHERTGQQLSIGRRWRIDTALKPMLRQRGITSLDGLAAMLVTGGEPGLHDDVVEALLNNETYFFRDFTVFEALMQQAAASLAARRPDRRLRVWSAGCSTGQEALSLAMGFAENRARWADWKIEIVGTDVSHAAIRRAREGLYSQFEIQRGLPVTRMMRWFAPEGESWRAHPELQEFVRFEVRNLLHEPPAPGRFDIILCRNVLLYFCTDLRRAAFARLAQASAPDGLLMLGAGETVIGHTDRFLADRECRGLYRPA